MAEIPKKHITIDEPSSSKKPKIDDNPPKETKERLLDFTFTVSPVTLLNNAFKALADTKFNSSQVALIQVGQGGCEITVWDIGIETGNDYFGYLGLKASELEVFECRNPVLKQFEWTGILKTFKASLKCETTKSVTIFAVEGSNKLSFQWGSTIEDFGMGQPVVIELQDPPKPCIQFPNISYTFEAVLPSPVLRTMFEELRNNATVSSRVHLTLKPATIEVSMGSDVASGSLVAQEEEQDEEQGIVMEWRHWEALISTTLTANKCSVYLVTSPQENLMLRFHLEKLGDFVFLNQAEFDKDPDKLTVLGHFRRLN